MRWGCGILAGRNMPRRNGPEQPLTKQKNDPFGGAAAPRKGQREEPKGSFFDERKAGEGEGARRAAARSAARRPQAAGFGRRPKRPAGPDCGSAGTAGRDPGGGQALVLTHSLANSTKRRAAGPVSAVE